LIITILTEFVIHKVDYFIQNKYGIKNIVGNVWEWTNDSWIEKNKVFFNFKIALKFL